MAWFIGQSAVMIVLAFLLGLLVGWIIWGRRVHALYVEVRELREAAATCEANHGDFADGGAKRKSDGAKPAKAAPSRPNSSRAAPGSTRPQPVTAERHQRREGDQRQRGDRQGAEIRRPGKGATDKASTGTAAAEIARGRQDCQRQGADRQSDERQGAERQVRQADERRGRQHVGGRQWWRPVARPTAPVPKRPT